MLAWLGPVGEAVNWTLKEGPGYNLVSGDLGDLLSIGVLGGLFTGVYRHWRAHECHVKSCHKVIWKTVPGTTHEVCRAHHPEDDPSHEQVLADHRKAKV